jgi:hypothetical protein
MSKRFLSQLSAALFVLTLLVFASSSARAAATIVIQNADTPSSGFNDPTPVAPVGGNTGTTLGQQRLNAFQFAANVWGATLNSAVTITIRAKWAPLTCSPSSGVLGQAGAIGIFSDFANAPFPATWYSEAEADALSGRDLDPASPEISATFNSNIGSAGCLDNGGSPTPFYLGLDNAHGAGIDLVAILMHEFAHGLGFQTFTSSSSGTQQSGMPSIYDKFLLDNTTGKTWDQMTNAERQASAINSSHLVWNGPQTTADVANTLGTARLRVNSPGGIAGNYTVGTAAFGARLSSPGLTANVGQATPADGCSALTNSGAIAGRIALIDRGTCTFVAKVKNAQDAGAVGVIIANSPTGVFGNMGGGDATITIPSVMISLTDGNTLKGQLSGLNATLLLDVSTPGGADAQGRAMMFAPNPIQSGSSVSHWDSVMFPDQLMEPSDSGDTTHSVTAPQDLTASLMRDIGWPMAASPAPSPSPSPNPIDTADFFVRQHYTDFLNRVPDTSGLNFWTDQITSCGTNAACIDAKRVNVSAAFYLSIEFQETGYLVERMYKSAYADASGTSTFNGTHTLSVPIVRFSEFLPDTQTIGQGVQVGVGNWQAQLEANKQSFADAFVRRTRFTNAYASNLTPTQLVDLLFANAGITPSSTQKNAAVAEFQGAGTSADIPARARALRDVAENSTLATNESNKAFVLMQYFGYLRRNPNDAPENGLNYSGYDFWLTKLNQFHGDFASADMVKAFITSSEYRQRFGP